MTFLSLISPVTQQPTTMVVDSTAASLSDGSSVTSTFFDMAMKGGFIMAILLILSIVAIYIFTERYWAIKKANVLRSDFMNRVKDYIYEGKISSALELCKQQNTPTARMIQKGISRIGRPLNDVNTAIENVGNMEIALLERGLTTLASISGGAPMIGFLGTVIGMIQAFMQMAESGNNIDVSSLSAGIYTAMVTTVGGLTVGIIAYFAYNFLIARVNKVVSKMEATTMEFMDLLNEPVKK